jgi:hypothetical protein
MSTLNCMHGLKIFVDQDPLVTNGGFQVFYSRRSDGPFYRWSYERVPMEWRGTRLHSSDFSTRNLCLSTWKSVPAPLQKSLIDHYQD